MESKNIFHVVTSYSGSIDTEVELPEGKTIADIDSIYVKWGEIHIMFKDETEFTCSESDFDAGDDIDWKRPVETEFFEANEDGYADFDKPILEEQR